MKGIGGSPIVEMHSPVPQEHLNGREPTVGQAAILGGGKGWSFADLPPHFRAMECNHSFNNEWHCIDGPLHVSDAGHTCQLTQDYVLAVQGLGVPFNPDFNGAWRHGVGTMQYTTWQNRRHDAVDAFLKPLAGSPRLTIRTDAIVSRVLVENGRARGVSVCQSSGDEKIYAEAEVLVAAGTYNSPKLLMLSGIGPAAHLAEHGIETVVDLPGVGENLQDHHEVPVVAATRGHHGYFGEDRGLRAIRNGLQYLLFRSGPVASVGVKACAYVGPDDPSDSSRQPIIKMYCIPAVYVDNDIEHIRPQEGVTPNAYLLRPASRGTVRLSSADPKDRPVVDNNYLAEPEDLLHEIAGLRFARQVMRSQPLAGRTETELLPGSDVDDDQGLAEHCRRTVKTNWHPVGTCGMGPDGDPGAVLDDRLCVRGLDGLRVIDASAMPFVPSGNTNAPTMALADWAIALMD